MREKNFFKSVILSFCLLMATPLISQSNETLSIIRQLDEKRVTINAEDKPLDEILSEITKQTRIGFAYDNNKVNKNKKMTLVVTDVSVKEALNDLFDRTEFKYTISDNIIHIGVKDIKNKKANRHGVKRMVSGKVLDTDDVPLPGAMVLIKGTGTGTIVDTNGDFIISVVSGDVLEITYVGYITTELSIRKESANILIKLKEDVISVDEVTVVAFGSQKKESVVSAVTTIKPMDLKSSNSDLTSSFAGKIAGMVGWQTSGLPGALTEAEMNTKFYIRGVTSFQGGANIDPLILLDGVEISKVDLSRISPEDIETFSVLKDASAAAMYGARGANGVILVTTKKGVEGSVYTTFRYETIMSQSTKIIDVVDPIDYMRSYNKAIVTRTPNLAPRYTAEDINNRISGKYPSYVYPQNDWYDILFKDFSINHHLGFNVRGGSKKIQYYASLNYNQDNGMIKTDQLNQFDNNVKNSTTSFRINMNINLKDDMRLVLNSTNSFDRNNSPYGGTSVSQQAYYMAFSASPVNFAPVYGPEVNDLRYTWPHIRFGVNQNGGGNPYHDLHSGYSDRTRYSTITRAEFIYEMDKILKGLEFRASMSFNITGLQSASYKTIPFTYRLTDYDFETKTPTLEAINPEQSDRTLSLNERATSHSSTVQSSYEAQLFHTAAWGGVDKSDHQTGVTAVLSAQRSQSAPPADIFDSFEDRNIGLSMRGTYGFLGKYFAEMSFGYNGSERFAEEFRMGFFPAGGLAWVASKENFMKSISNTFSYLKFRASWGKVGNDGIINKPRYVYLPTITNPEVSDPMANKTKFPRYSIDSYPNPSIMWEIAEKYNLGIETGFFNNMLTVNVDLYQEFRHNILSYRRTIPISLGLEQHPLDNIGKSKSYGVDIEAKIQHAFTSDLWVIFNGTFTYNRAKYEYIEESTNKPHWQQKKGRDLSQSLGYIAEGLFQDQVEIDNAPYQGGQSMPGDIRYRDLDRNGVIDVNDATYIGHPENPGLIYGFSGFINYKSFEFSFAFQGSGVRSLFMDPEKISPFIGDRAMLQAIHDSHWSEDNMTSQPLWPRLSQNNIIDYNPQEYWYENSASEVRKSTYFMRSAQFLRCTSIELGYNMPSRFANKVKLQNMKFYFRTNNPFVISDFDIWDVELGENGFNYPIQRTFSLGISVGF